MVWLVSTTHVHIMRRPTRPKMPREVGDCYISYCNKREYLAT